MARFRHSQVPNVAEPRVAAVRTRRCGSCRRWGTRCESINGAEVGGYQAIMFTPDPEAAASSRRRRRPWRGSIAPDRITGRTARRSGSKMHPHARWRARPLQCDIVRRSLTSLLLLVGCVAHRMVRPARTDAAPDALALGRSISSSVGFETDDIAALGSGRAASKVMETSTRELLGVVAVVRVNRPARSATSTPFVTS